MRRQVFIAILAVAVLSAFAPTAFAVQPVYYPDCITWTPFQPRAGQQVTFALDPDFMASIGCPPWTLKNVVLQCGEDAYQGSRQVFDTAGHYDLHVTMLLGTGVPFDDDGAGPNPAAYNHTFIADIGLDVVPVPEPSSLLALACGLGVVLHGMARRRRM